MNKARFAAAPVLVVFLVALDQLTKIWAVSTLADHDVDLIPGVLSFHYLRNTGAAFSILENQMLFFYVITVVVCAWLVLIYARLARQGALPTLRIILLFILAGAIGNLIDRVLYQYVNDFIYFKLINFPVFNVADIYVTCAVFALLALFIFVYKEADVDLIFDAAKPWRKI